MAHWPDRKPVRLDNQIDIDRRSNLSPEETMARYLVGEGRPVVVTDAPALYEAGTPNKQKVLGLVESAAIVHDAGDVISNIETSNGQTRIETTMQVDYTFGLGLKGYTWDETNGGKSPTDAELATGTNWDQVATSVKHTAGVIAVGDAAQ